MNINIENHLAEGGFTGITLLLYFIFSLDPSYTNLILNIPIFFIGWKLLGRTTFLYTLIGTFSVSLFLWVFQRYEVLNLHLNLQNDMTLAALFAGAFIGIGLGIIFKYGGTTGGVDIIARLPTNMLAGVWEKRCLCLMPSLSLSLFLHIYHIEKACIH